MASFHRIPTPSSIRKIWLLRYRSALGELSYRFLCLSRNLTFDRSWDTLLRLDGEAKADGMGPDTTPIAEFIRVLPGLAINPIEPERIASLNVLADELTHVTFALPDGFRAATFWPMGHDGIERWPLDGRVDRLLTISPFLTIPMLSRLTTRGKNHTLVSRPESLDAVGANALGGFAEVLTLSSVALADPEGQLEPSSSDEALAEGTEHELQGLHAKCYVADAGGTARVWTGSANATNAAFSGNVEFLVELTGPKAWFGVDVTLGQRPGQPSLRSILEPYTPSNAEPRELTVAEQLDQELDALRRWLASHRFEAQVRAAGADLYEVTLRGIAPRSGAGTELPTGVTCRPLTTRGAAARVVAVGEGLTVSFPGLSFEALTSFFVFTAKASRDGQNRELEFVVNAELLGAPDDRRQRILASLLKNREELLRFLLMLLSGMGESGQLAEAALGGGTWAWAWSESTALFEPMVRALARDPAKIDEIASLMQELMKTPGWAIDSSRGLGGSLGADPSGSRGNHQVSSPDTPAGSPGASEKPARRICVARPNGPYGIDAPRKCTNPTHRPTAALCIEHETIWRARLRDGIDPARKANSDVDGAAIERSVMAGLKTSNGEPSTTSSSAYTRTQSRSTGSSWLTKSVSGRPWSLAVWWRAPSTDCSSRA